MENILLILLVLTMIIAIVAVMSAFYWRSRFCILQRESTRKIKELQSWLVQSGFDQSRF